MAQPKKLRLQKSFVAKIKGWLNDFTIYCLIKQKCKYQMWAFSVWIDAMGERFYFKECLSKFHKHGNL